jgi:hypothetical protein
MTPQFRFTALVVLALFAGCAALENLKPRNIGEGILLADAIILQAATTVATLRDDGVISQEQALEQRDRLRRAADEVDAAREAYLLYRRLTGDSAASERGKAERRLETALSLARSVQSWLEGRST